MFRNVPECSMFLVLSTPVYGKVFCHKKLYSLAFKGICFNPELKFLFYLVTHNLTESLFSSCCERITPRVSFYLRISLRRAVDKTRNTEHAGTCRNMPEHSGTSRNMPKHEKIKIIFMKKKYIMK